MQYDDVMNKHREIIYKRRQKTLLKLAESEAELTDEETKTEDLAAQPLHADILQALKAQAEGLMAVHASSVDPEQWNIREIRESIIALHPAFEKAVTTEKLRSFNDREALQRSLENLLTSFYEKKCEKENPRTIALAERIVTLRSIDTHWMDHIDDMAHLREQVAFSGYAQRDPLVEYKDQGFRRFQQLIVTIDATIARTLLQVDFAQFAPRAYLQRMQEEVENIQTNESQISQQLEKTGVDSRSDAQKEGENPLVMRAPQQSQGSLGQRAMPKVGRNDPCPCGAKKSDGTPIKYKHCHGKNI